MTDKPKDICFRGTRYKIDRIKCRNHTICLSDFKYTSLDGNEYNMIETNKGYNGEWHIIKSLTENKLYATNNLWDELSVNSTDMNAIIIDTKISFSTIEEKYGDKNIHFINSLDYINETDIDEIKLNCEKSIEEHKKLEFKNNNLIKHIFCGSNNDLDIVQIISYPRNMNINDKVYEVNYGSHCGGNFSDFFDNFNDTKEHFFKKLYLVIKNMDKYLEQCIEDENIDCLDNYLIKIPKKYLKQDFLENSHLQELVLVKSKILNDYIQSKNSLINNDDIYVINIKHYEILKKLFNFTKYKN
jgi:hypothetical protein